MNQGSKRVPSFKCHTSFFMMTPPSVFFLLGRETFTSSSTPSLLTPSTLLALSCISLFSSLSFSLLLFLSFPPLSLIYSPLVFFPSTGTLSTFSPHFHYLYRCPTPPHPTGYQSGRISKTKPNPKGHKLQLQSILNHSAEFVVTHEHPTTLSAPPDRSRFCPPNFPPISMEILRSGRQHFTLSAR